jgi:hypothetical protein
MFQKESMHTRFQLSQSSVVLPMNNNLQIVNISTLLEKRNLTINCRMILTNDLSKV